jgi:hypothetical protein
MFRNSLQAQPLHDPGLRLRVEADATRRQAALLHLGARSVLSLVVPEQFEPWLTGAAGPELLEPALEDLLQVAGIAQGEPGRQ